MDASPEPRRSNARSLSRASAEDAGSTAQIRTAFAGRRLPSPVPLSTANLSFAYPRSAPVLRDISASFEPASITAIIGPNGVGKSTLLRLLLNLLTPTTGSITLDGAPLSQLHRRERASRLAYVPQRASVVGPFTTRAVVELGQYATAHNTSRESDNNSPRASIDRALAAVDLAPHTDKIFSTLSVGQQQRATLARALAQLHLPTEASALGSSHSPSGVISRFLLLDEPVSAMDPAHAFRTMDLLRTLASQGLGVVIVLHDLALVARYADRVIALHPDGSCIAQGSTAATLTPDLLSSLFGVPFRSATIAGDATPILLPHHP